MLDKGKFYYFSSREEWSKLAEEAERKGARCCCVPARLLCDCITCSVFKMRSLRFPRAEKPINRAPYELIKCDVLPAEGEEGDPVTDGEEDFEEPVLEWEPFPFHVAGGEGPGSPRAAAHAMGGSFDDDAEGSNAATQSYFPGTPVRGQGAGRLSVRRRTSDASGVSSISFMGTPGKDSRRSSLASQLNTPDTRRRSSLASAYSLTPEFSPDGTVDDLPLTPMSTRNLSRADGKRKKGKKFGEASKRISKFLRKADLPPDTFGFYIEPRDNRRGHRCAR